MDKASYGGRAWSILLCCLLTIVLFVILNSWSVDLPLKTRRPAGLAAAVPARPGIIDLKIQRSTVEALYQRQWHQALNFYEERRQRGGVRGLDMWDIFGRVLHLIISFLLHPEHLQLPAGQAVTYLTYLPLLAYHFGRISTLRLPTWIICLHSCPLMERIGHPLDGGKWICAASELLNKKGCVVFSVGSQGETSFERAVLKLNPGCQVHTFDHTIRGKHLQRVLNVTGINLHRQGICSAAQLLKGEVDETKFTSVLGAMASANVKWLDVLKMDIEGWEWPVFAELLENEASLPFTQILIELHAESITRFKGDLPSTWGSQLNGMHEFFTGLHKKGFRAFSAEPNLRANPRNLLEYSFMQVGDSGNYVVGY